MLIRRLKQTLITGATYKNNFQHNFLMASRYFSKRCFIFDNFVAVFSKFEHRNNMSYVRISLKDISVAKLWGHLSRSSIMNTVKRCKCDLSMRELIHRFRQTVLRPRKTLFLYATAAYKSHSDETDESPQCSQNITDEDLEALMSELDGVNELSKHTLYCTGCGKRLVIDKKQSGVQYCACKDSVSPETSHDGWEPYMEAEDVIIWRKEYKPGQGLYAYKVYGRYKDVMAQDFAAVQVDGAYRRVWDAAVASLSVVERTANGLQDQAVLHWEVLWPRLFANRDYVYIRRHKEYEMNSSSPASEKTLYTPPRVEERPSVHSHAKRKAIENDQRERERSGVRLDDKAFIIISRSCEHPDVPETKHAIRVSEYWSHMIVKTINGSDKPGMEFVLTYYDEPAVGGLPSGVAAWATGRAAPAYLDRMRRAAADYGAWRQNRDHEDIPDFVYRREKDHPESMVEKFREQDMESSKEGPELENSGETKREQATQTDDVTPNDSVKNSQTDRIKNSQSDQFSSEEAVQSDSTKTVQNITVKEINRTDTRQTSVARSQVKGSKQVEASKEAKTNSSSDQTSIKEVLVTRDGDSEKAEEEGSNSSKGGSWWRYLYPFYYFV